MDRSSISLGCAFAAPTRFYESNSERARLSAESNGIIGFKASRAWMQKFLRRTGTQNHSACTEKGAQQCRLITPTRMEELRSLASKVDVTNIYNQDESGLLYRMGPNRS